MKPQASTLTRRSRPALFSKDLARQLARQFAAVKDNELLRDCLDLATSGVLDPWQLDTLTDWTRQEIDATAKRRATP